LKQKQRYEAQAAHNLRLMHSAQDELRAANATVRDLRQQLSASHARVQTLENRSISVVRGIGGISNALEEMRRELCPLPETSDAIESRGCST
jgi:2-succinyl-5-enolpyruvyl-6-hydroxy-3-cyclohexene-1-carboxylate synthase